MLKPDHSLAWNNMVILLDNTGIKTNPCRDTQLMFEPYSIITVKLICHYLVPSNTQITRQQVLRVCLHYNC